MKYAFALFLALIVILFFYFDYGVPIHDFNLWKIELAYAKVPHPSDSVVLEKKTYLGGPSEHGSGHCSYIVGEVRSSPEPKESIRRAYEGFFVTQKRLPITVRFLDGSWELGLPWMNWEGELEKKYGDATSTMYLVYAAEENHPYWGDLRCDD